MRYLTGCASILGIALALIISAGSANAQATRTWVSGVGDDANPCSRTAPCKTFAGSISKTAAGGEINCLDPGGFGAVTIIKSISIICETGTAGVLVSGTNGIVVNLPNTTDMVMLQGLDIQGVGTGINGVNMIGNGVVVVRKCIINGFTLNGVNVNGPNGARATIEDSFISKNAVGVQVHGVSAVANTGVIQNSTIDSNITDSIKPSAGSTIVLTNSILSGTAVSIDLSAGGSVLSYGNNVIRGSGSPTQTLAPQ